MKKPRTPCEAIAQLDKMHIRPFLVKWASPNVTSALYSFGKPIFIKMLVKEGEFLAELDKMSKELKE